MLLLMSRSTSTIATQSHGKQFICNEIQQRHVVNQNQLNSRALTFLLFDTAGAIYRIWYES